MLPYPGSVQLLDHLAERGTKVAVVSSSRNAPPVLEAAGLAERFEVVVDGNVAAREHLPGKPAPDTFAYAAAQLGVPEDRAVVFEDALSGVEAGPGRPVRAGGRGRPGRRGRAVDRVGGRRGGHRSRRTGRVMLVPAPDDPILVSDPLDRMRFPIDEWALTEAEYRHDDLGVTETLFAVGNGYLGLRGNVEEGRETHSHGTFINGFHETWPIRHAEEAFGFARTGQTIVNVPDNKTMKLYVDDEPMLLSVADIEDYERTLDFRDGVLRREIIWRTPGGKRVQVSSQRMVSFTQRHLAIMTFEVTMLDDDAPVVISSQTLNRQDGRDEYHVRSAAMGGGVDPRQAEAFDDRVLEPQSHWWLRRADHPELALRQLEDDHRRRQRPRDHHRQRLPGLHQRRGGHGQDGLPGAGQGRAADQGDQDRRLPHLARRPHARARGPLPPHPGPGAGVRHRGRVRRPADLAGRVLGPLRRRGRTASRRCSRRCAGTCSRWPRRPPGPSSPAYRPRG